MKKHIGEMSIILAIICLISMMPVYAASSSFWFEMNTNGRVINGSDNGAYHSLDKGVVSISGTATTNASQNLNGNSNTVYVQLLNKTSGNSFGTVTFKPSASLGDKVHFSGTYSSVGGGSKYYLMIYRNQSDGLGFTGSGTLKNQ